MPAHTFHHVCLNPAPGVKQDEQAGFYSSRHQPWLTDRHTHIIHSSQAHHTVQLCWVLTDTSQQQLYSKWNRENNNESDAWRCLALFCLCMAAIAAHSGCSSILLPELDSCPLIYIPNLAAIEIPRLLVTASRSLAAPPKPALGVRTTLPSGADASSINPNMCEEKVGSA